MADKGQKQTQFPFQDSILIDSLHSRFDYWRCDSLPLAHRTPNPIQSIGQCSPGHLHCPGRVSRNNLRDTRPRCPHMRVTRRTRTSSPPPGALFVPPNNTNSSCSVVLSANWHLIHRAIDEPERRVSSSVLLTKRGSFCLLATFGKKRNPPQN